MPLAVGGATALAYETCRAYVQARPGAFLNGFLTLTRNAATSRREAAAGIGEVTADELAGDTRGGLS
jgi:hypothetical protein